MDNTEATLYTFLPAKPRPETSLKRFLICHQTGQKKFIFFPKYVFGNLMGMNEEIFQASMLQL